MPLHGASLVADGVILRGRLCVRLRGGRSLSRAGSPRRGDGGCPPCRRRRGSMGLVGRAASDGVERTLLREPVRPCELATAPSFHLERHPHGRSRERAGGADVPDDC